MASSKVRMNVYFEPRLLKEVSHLAARKRWTKSSIIEAAVASFLSADSAERQEAALSRRLDRLSRQIEGVERDQRVAIEAIAVFVRHWLTVTPALTTSAQAAARAAGRDRFKAYVDAVAREIARDAGMAGEIRESLEGAAADAAGLGASPPGAT